MSALPGAGLTELRNSDNEMATSSFPRRRETILKHWLPAFAGITKTGANFGKSSVHKNKLVQVEQQAAQILHTEFLRVVD